MWNVVVDSGPLIAGINCCNQDLGDPRQRLCKHAPPRSIPFLSASSPPAPRVPVHCSRGIPLIFPPRGYCTVPGGVSYAHPIVEVVQASRRLLLVNYVASNSKFNRAMSRIRKLAKQFRVLLGFSKFAEFSKLGYPETPTPGQ